MLPMNDEAHQRRSIFYPLTMVTAWSVPGAIFLVLGGIQILMVPQGSGAQLDDTFWHPLVPFGVAALVALGIAGVFWRFKTARDVFLSAGIVLGCGTLGFGMMWFALAERASIDDFVRAAPIEPENNYICKRQSDGTIKCLNELGEANPNFTSTIVRR